MNIIDEALNKFPENYFKDKSKCRVCGVPITYETPTWFWVDADGYGYCKTERNAKAIATDDVFEITHHQPTTEVGGA